MFDKWAQGPIREEAGGGEGGGGVTPELKAALTSLIKPMLNESINAAINTALKGQKQETQKGTKEIQTQIDSLKQAISGMKPKKAAKLLRRLGIEQDKKAGEGKAAEGKTSEQTKKPPTEEELKTKSVDLFKKRQFTELEERIAALEAENKNVKAEATEAKKLSALDRALSDLPWASVESRDMARDFYAPKLKWNDEGELMIGEKPFDQHIKAEIPAKFENLLAPTGKTGAGLSRGQGHPGQVDIDALTAPNSTLEQKAQASREIAALMGARG